MVSMIKNGTVFMEVSEIVNYLKGLREDMINKKKSCLEENNHMNLIPELKELANKLTTLDYDMFIEKLEYTIKDISRHLQQEKWTTKIPSKLKTKG